MHGYKNSNVCSHLITFALMTTEAFSRNISKIFSELKLVPDNLLFIPRLLSDVLYNMQQSWDGSREWGYAAVFLVASTYILIHLCTPNPALNLMLCYYAVSDRDKLKKCFHRMLQISTGISDEDRYYPAVVSCLTHLPSLTTEILDVSLGD